MIESGFLPWAPGVEEGALDGQAAVKTGEQERRAAGLGGAGCGVLKERDQFEGQAGRAEQVAGAAGFVKGGEPTAEGGCIVLPTGAGGRAQESGNVGAEQFVGFQGQGGEAVARAFEEGGKPAVGSGQAGPEGLLLGRVQQQAAIERARSPGGADEAIPVQDVGRGPGGEAFGLAGTMEGGAKGAGCALAGRNHEATAAQPFVELSFRSCSHSSVIRFGPGGMPWRGDREAGAGCTLGV